jgi:hypothetical protein
MHHFIPVAAYRIHGDKPGALSIRYANILSVRYEYARN